MIKQSPRGSAHTPTPRFLAEGVWQSQEAATQAQAPTAAPSPPQWGAERSCSWLLPSPRVSGDFMCKQERDQPATLTDLGQQTGMIRYNCCLCGSGVLGEACT